MPGALPAVADGGIGAQTSRHDGGQALSAAHAFARAAALGYARQRKCIASRRIGQSVRWVLERALNALRAVQKDLGALVPLQVLVELARKIVESFDYIGVVSGSVLGLAWVRLEIV